MWEKFKAQVEKHPYIFGGVALVVVALIFFGGKSGGSSSGGTSAISAAESQAIADSAQANAQLQLSHDQVQVAGLNDATQQAINAQNTAAAVNINGQNTDAAQAINKSQVDAWLTATLNNNATAITLNQSNNDVLNQMTQADLFTRTVAQTGHGPNVLQNVGGVLVNSAAISSAITPTTANVLAAHAVADYDHTTQGR